MNHWVIAPVLLPAILAVGMMLLQRQNLMAQRVAGLSGTGLLWLLSLWLIWRARLEGIEVYLLGNWPAPFGIVLVLDRLTALMLLLTATLALLALAYAVATRWDARGGQFHPLFQFQLMGLNGAFLTGDLFNLFVFFEVMLIASYGLMVHSGGAARLRAGLQFMVMNLSASVLFLFALGTLYAVTGTLNMAHMAERVAAMPAADAALMRVGAMLLLLVFAVKAALVPLHFWLPATYEHAPGPVAAMFAVMTKVGAYAILRMFTLIFPDSGASAGLTGWLLPASLITLALGALASLGATNLARLAGFASIASMGTILLAFALPGPAGTVAGLYYMVHSTFAGAALFLIADRLAAQRHVGGALTAAPFPGQGRLAGLFLVAAIGMAGMPPLAGFLGKLMLLQAAWTAPQMPVIWAVVLGAALVLMVAFARAGSILFWKSVPQDIAPTKTLPADRLSILMIVAVLAAMVAVAVGGGPVSAFLAATARQLHAPADYITAVLGLAEDER